MDCGEILKAGYIILLKYNCDVIMSDNYFSITGLEPVSVNAPKDKIRVSENFKGTLEDDLFWETIYTTYV